MKFDRKSINIGDSVGVIIPSDICHKAGIVKGTSVRIDYNEHNRTITVEPVHPAAKQNVQATSPTVREGIANE